MIDKPEADSVVITGMGLMTSVGHNAPQSLTSIRAGITRFSEIPQYVPVVREPGMYFPEPAIGSPVTGVTDGLEGIERLLAMSVPALKEAISDANLEGNDLQETMILVAGGQRPDIMDGSRQATVFVPRLASRASGFSFAGHSYFPQGNVGFLLALKKGIELLNHGRCKCCIIGGVDSWLDTETLSWLDKVRRLKSESNVDAFIPGEGAAFAVIELKKNALGKKKKIYAKISTVVSKEEKHTIWSDTVCTAEGLSFCLKSISNGLIKKDMYPDAVLCDLNGESYRSTEWGYALTKSFQDKCPVPPIVIHPADCFGDVGSATGGILLTCTAFLMKKDYANWDSAIIWCSSDNGERAAVSVLK